MPIIYENEGHRRRMIKTGPAFAWKISEWRKNKVCWICEREMHIEVSKDKPKKQQASLDHKLARSMGGLDEPDNWQLICLGCNNMKSKIEQKLLLLMKKPKKKKKRKLLKSP